MTKALSQAAQIRRAADGLYAYNTAHPDLKREIRAWLAADFCVHVSVVINALKTQRVVGRPRKPRCPTCGAIIREKT